MVKVDSQSWRSNSEDEEKAKPSFTILNNHSNGAGEIQPAAPPLPEGTAPRSGVSKVQAFNRILYDSGAQGKILLITLAVSIGCTMFVYALDQGITYQFTIAAASQFGKHAQIGTVATAAEIIRAISKPFLAKIADITSRPATYCLVLVFYVIGFVVAASCTTISAYIVGIAFTAFGKSGLDLLGDIIVADLTPLEWRGFFSSLLSVPFLITTPLDGFISQGFVPDDWRWGLGMFAIMVPVLLAPAIITLYAMQSKAYKMGMVSAGASGKERKGQLEAADKPSYLVLVKQGMIDINLVGLVLLGFAFSLVLLPFTLVDTAKDGWSNPSMISMIVVGFMLMMVFVVHEIYIAPKPLMTKSIIQNRAFLAALGVDVCTQMASGLRTTYFASYVWIIKDWSQYAWTIFIGSVTLGLCFFGPIAGLIQRKTHRYKSLMVFGAVSKLLANGVLMAGNGGSRATMSTAALVVSQIMFALGAFTVVGARVGSQASVPHEDMSTVIAGLSLWSTLGSSIGSAVSTAIWSNTMVRFMTQELEGESPARIRTLYGSIKSLHDLPFDDTVRQGGIIAYARVMNIIIIVSIVVAALALFFSLLMPNFYLGKQQNVITNVGLDGRPVEPTLDPSQEARPRSVWEKLKKAYYDEDRKAVR